MDSDKYREEHIRTFDNLDINYARRNDPGSYINAHRHDAVEIIFLLSGIAEVMIQQETYKMKAGEIVLINAGMVHSTTNIYGNRSIVMQIPMDLLRKYLEKADEVVFDLPIQTADPIIQKRLDQLKKLMMKMGDVIGAKDDGFALEFHSLVYEFLYQLYVNFSRRVSKGQKDFYKEEDRLSQVIAYTREHYAERIQICDVASLIYLQPEYFCRFFKKAMGITYLEYLNEYRLSLIYQDLINTDVPVCKILQKHGFTNYKLFRKLFHEKFQCTPTGMREQRKDVVIPDDACQRMGTIE